MDCNQWALSMSLWRIYIRHSTPLPILILPKPVFGVIIHNCLIIPALNHWWSSSNSEEYYLLYQSTELVWRYNCYSRWLRLIRTYLKPIINQQVVVSKSKWVLRVRYLSGMYWFNDCGKRRNPWYDTVLLEANFQYSATVLFYHLVSREYPTPLRTYEF
jgi:hypothetical protein